MSSFPFPVFSLKTISPSLLLDTPNRRSKLVQAFIEQPNTGNDFASKEFNIYCIQRWIVLSIGLQNLLYSHLCTGALK